MEIGEESERLEISLLSDLLLDLNWGDPTAEVTLAFAFERYENISPLDTKTGGVRKNKKNTNG